MNEGEAPVVDTPHGAVRGRVEDGIAVFRGIPFAAPPVGEHRLGPPSPPGPWSGVLDAATFGPAPPQSAVGPPRPPAGPDDARGWLTVNVWTPRPRPAGGPDRPLPVLVWVYGGAYRSGSSAEPVYDGALLAREAGAVVVTSNHRVGTEGYAHVEGAPANRGLLDVVAALAWVRDGIGAFGGDPGQVTVFGESAGAGAVASLLAMPAARGLFRRAILQSVPGTFLSDALGRDIGAAIAAKAGVPATRGGLASVDPEALTAAGDAVGAAMPARWGVVAATPTPYSPVVDGEVLPTTPWRALAQGAATGVDLVVGHTRDEFRLFLGLAGVLGRVTDEMADHALATFAPDADAYRAAFGGAGAEDLVVGVQSDWLFRMPSLRIAQEQVAAGGRVWCYELVAEAPGQGGALGACHGLDVPLVFGNLTGGFLAGMLLGADPPPRIAAVSATMRRAWAAFARGDGPGWPAYDETHRRTWLVDAPPQVAPYPEDRSRELFADHGFDPLPLLAE